MLPWGLYEDAATGSAAGSLGAYLVRNGKLAPGHTLSILQGAEMGRPSQIEVEVTQNGKKLVPRVSGAAVKVFEGTIRICLLSLNTKTTKHHPANPCALRCVPPT